MTSVSQPSLAIHVSQVEMPAHPSLHTHILFSHVPPSPLQYVQLAKTEGSKEKRSRVMIWEEEGTIIMSDEATQFEVVPGRKRDC